MTASTVRDPANRTNVSPGSRVSKQATGKKENYKRVENPSREVLRKSESQNRAQVGWR